MDLTAYRQTATGERLPGYARCNSVYLDLPRLDSLSDEELWAVHDSAIVDCTESEHKISLLDVKIELAKRMLHRCHLCERRCGVDRGSGQVGFCGVTDVSSVFFEQVLCGEEAPLVPSHEVFFSGCNMRCRFCYSWEALIDTSRGNRVVPEEFASLIDRRRSEGAVNLNLIGGEPTVHLPAILESLKFVRNHTAVVWNSNFHMSAETMRLLDGIVDLYVGDLRFGNNRCAKDVGVTERYFDVAARNFKAAAASGDLIIRHLLLPGHIDCCLRPIAKWIAENLPDSPFHLMFQYTPFFAALDDSTLSRSLSQEEEQEAAKIVSSLGLNTDRWNTPLSGPKTGTKAGSGKIETTVIVKPDGRIAVLHLHEDLQRVVQALEDGG